MPPTVSVSNVGQSRFTYEKSAQTVGRLRSSVLCHWSLERPSLRLTL